MVKDRKQQIEDLMRKYVDNNNCIDIYKFRKENPNEYSLLSHYFGGVNQAIEELGFVKISKTRTKSGTRVTLRNRLAYEALKSMRKDQTLEEIAQKMGVSKAAINQLYIALKSSIEEELMSQKGEV